MQLDDESLARILDAMPPEEPPADLRSTIMGAVSQPGSSIGRARHARRATLSVAWAVAAAIVAGFFVFSTVRDRQQAAATMASAAVSVTSTEDLVTLHVRTAGSISVRWDPRAADLVAISGATDASSRKDQATFIVRSTSARAAVTLRVRGDARSLPLSVSVDGRRIYSESISVK